LVQIELAIDLSAIAQTSQLDRAGVDHDHHDELLQRESLDAHG
jgi:hypothetical protein